MKKKFIEDNIAVIRIIGYALALLYAFVLSLFLGAIDMPVFDEYSVFYIVMFALMFIGALAVVMLREWGRKLVIAVNMLMFICLVIRYVPAIGIMPIGFLFLNIIIFLYFNQPKIKNHFFAKRFSEWKTILIIDDDETHLKTVRPILIANGFSVLIADSGETGLQIVKHQKPDLILLDVILPGIKGREVCKKIKEDESTKNIPVIFLTAKDSPDDVEAEKEVGGEAHLTKPVDGKVLLKTIEKILKRNKSA